jgi:hypothetical protein
MKSYTFLLFFIDRLFVKNILFQLLLQLLFISSLLIEKRKLHRSNYFSKKIVDYGL